MTDATQGEQAPAAAAKRRSHLLAAVRWGVPALGLLILGLMPLFGLGPNGIRLLFITFVWTAASIGWNLLGGFTGQVSFGFAVFYGLGAYATAMSLNAGLPRTLALLVAACVAALASVLIGIPTFRLRGPYFAIATIGVSEAVRVVMTNIGATGGASGYRLLEHGAFNQSLHYYFALGVAALAVAISIVVRRSKFGLALLSIREDQDAASDLGVNPFRGKLLAHGLAAAITGAAAGVYTGYAAFIYPDGVFGFDISIAILLMPTIGGVGTIWGPVIGGFVYGLVHEELIASFPQLHLLLYGSLLILIVLFEPRGVVGLLESLLRFARARSGSVPHP
jgi:branched-chain amino acid transport system permease protein